MNLKIGSHSFHLSLTVLAIVAGALFMYTHLGGDPALAAWRSMSKQELATEKTWHARTAQLAGQAARARAAAAGWSDSVDVLSDSLDSLLARAGHPVAGAAPVTLAQVGAGCRLVISACEARGDSLAAADSLDRLRADSAERRALAADSIVHLGIKAVSCHFLVLFPCPSREQAFFLGAAVTAIGAAVTHH